MTEQEDKVLERQSFTFFLSFEKGIRKLSDTDQLQMYRAIARYSLWGEIPELTGCAAMAWEFIFPVLEKGRKAFENGMMGAEYGHLGGAPKGNQNARKQKGTTPKQPLNNPQTTPHIQLTHTINNNTNTQTNNSSATSVRFTPPSIEDVRMYVREASLDIDAEEFMDYGIANGWKLSNGNPMKDWRATLRQWHRRKNQQKENQQRKGNGQQHTNIADTLHPQMCDYGESTI